MEKPGKAKRERLERVGFFVAFAFLLLLGGMLLARLNLFPYPFVDDAVTAARAAAIQLGWMPDVETGVGARDGERSDQVSGVTVHDAQLSAGGYTLFTSGSNEAAYLIDMQGRLVHQWTMPFKALREKFGSDAIPDIELGWRSTHLYPDGDLLVVLQRRRFTPYGFALMRLDRNSKVEWINYDYAHHDVTVSEDGRIFTVGQAIRKEVLPGLRSLKAPFLEDYVLVIADDGKTLERVSIMEAFVDTPYASAVKQLVQSRDWKGDYFHVNAIEPYDSRNPVAILKPGQVLVSIRNMDALATIDLASGKVVWLLRGTWVRQHDPDIADGRIILFDNRGDFSRGGHSRVLEFEPVSQQITWQADVGEGYDLYSGWGGSQQVLENGNVLITETAPGRVLELTRDHRLVWLYHSAGREESTGYSPPVQEARRYPESYIAFELDAP